MFRCSDLLLKPDAQVPRQVCSLELGPPQIISKPLRTEWCLDGSTSSASPTPPSSTNPPPTSRQALDGVPQYQGQLLDSLQRLRRQFSKTLRRKGNYLWWNDAKYNFLFETRIWRNLAQRVESSAGRWRVGIKWEFQSSKGSSFKVLLAFNLC